MRDFLVAGLDIGSSHIGVAVAGLDSSGGTRLVGHGQASSDGILAGEVLDADAFSSALGSARDEIRRIAGRDLTDAYITVSGLRITGHERSGRLDRTGTGVFSRADVMRALPDAVRFDTRDERTVHRVVQTIAIDGIEIDEPGGVRGVALAVRTRDYTAPRASLDAICAAAARAGFQVHALVPAGVAAATAAMTDAECRLGVVVIDIGYASTDVGIYCAGILFDVVSVPVGGYHITSDLTQLLGIGYRDAERLKRIYGAAHPLDEDSLDFSARTIAGWQRQAQQGEAPREAVQAVAGARMMQLFGRIDDALTTRDVRLALLAGGVLTGGGARLAGIDAIAGSMLSMDCRVGGVVAGDGFASIADPSAASVVGLVRHCLSRSTKSASRRSQTRPEMSTAVRLPAVDWRGSEEPTRHNAVVGYTGDSDSRRWGQSVARWMRDFIPARHG